MDDSDSNQKNTGTSVSGVGFCRDCGGQHAQAPGICPQNGTDCREPAQDALIGKTIGGKYQILEVLGKGGMSVVYKARQQPINRIVALKMMAAHLSRDPQSIMRFLQEAKAAGQISHPNVVNVSDFGVAEDQQPYLVMEFVHGETLSQFLKERPCIPYKEAIPYFIQICDGLAAAHEKGIVHRDIKPSNIVLQSLSGEEKFRVRVVDFGIAKMIDAESQQLTKTGEIFGSPFYMSPEQCDGMQLDNRTDIYSLGVVFYETLSGVCPLAGKTTLETMRLHLEAMPESLQKAGLSEPVPLALENIIFKMMSRDREKRYSSMLEVKRDLAQVISGDTAALSGQLSYVGREISRKSKLIRSSVAAFVFVTILGVLAYPQLCLALAKQEYDQGNAALSGGQAEDAETHLKKAVELSHIAGDKGAESRSLASLVRVYRLSRKRELMEKARSRRQALIREELSRLDINAVPIDVIAALPANESKAAKHNNLQISNPRLQLGASDVLETDSLSKTGMDAKDKRELSNEAAGSIALADNRPQRTTTAQRSKTKLVSALDEESALNHHAVSDGGKASNGDSVGLSFVGQSSKLRGTDSAAINAKLKSGAGSRWSSGPISLDAKSAVARNQGGADSGVNFSLSGSETGTFDAASASLNPDSLDDLEVVADLSVDKKAYAKAKESSDKAISLYKALNYEPGSELAKLYTTRDWACVNLGECDSALSDVRTAIDLAQKTGISTPEEVEAESLQSLIYLEKGKSAEAKICMDRACSLLRSGAKSSKIADFAMKRYNDVSAKSGH